MAKKLLDGVVITPSDYFQKIETEDPRGANLIFFHCDIVNNQITNKIDQNNFAVRDLLIGGKSARTTTVGDGMSFECVSGASIAVAKDGSVVRSFKWFLDDTYKGEVLYGGDETALEIIKLAFEPNGNVRKIDIVNTSVMYIDYISLCPFDLNTINSNKSLHPVIEIEPIENTYIFDTKGKVTGDITHPVKIKYATNVIDPLLLNPTDFLYEIPQSYYDNTNFYNTSMLPVAETDTDTFSPILLEYNMSVTKSPLYSIKNNLPEIIAKLLTGVWAYGGLYDGLNNPLNVGIELYVRNTTMLVWELASSHSINAPTLMEWSEVANIIDYIDGEKLYLMLKTAYPADGVNDSNGLHSSKIYLNYGYLESVVVFCGVSSIKNKINNLIPPLTSADWTIITPYGKIIDDYELEITREDAGTAGYVDIPVNPYRAYTLHADGNCVIYVQSRNKDKVLISNLTTISTGSRTFTYNNLSCDCRYLRIYPAIITGKTATMINPILTATDTAQPFAPQSQYNISLTQQSLGAGDKIAVDGTMIKAYKNDQSILENIDQTSKDEGFLLESGLNHLQCTFTGGFAKVTVIDEQIRKIAAINETYFPDMTKISKSSEELIEYTNTPGGSIRLDLVAIDDGTTLKPEKESWDIETPWLPKATIEEFENYLKSLYYAPFKFWLDDFGGGGKAVEVIIRPSTKQIKRDSEHYKRLKLTCKVEEV